MIIDADERSQALDVTRSFIVQAPAGSGKTELLIQRLLSLLAHSADEPEQIIAITFTRKAAAEMRKRLLNTLMIASTEPAPPQPHALMTWTLAKTVLEVDAKRQWHLLDNPNRLRLQTIDSLCASIARSAPYLSQFGAEPSVFSDALPYYQQAAQALMKTLSQTTPWQSALARLFLHLDNDWNSVQQLLTTMLGRRDQWLAHLLEENDLPSKRKALEHSLQHVITDTLQQVVATFPDDAREEGLFLFRCAATVLCESDKHSPFQCFLDITEFPGSSIDDLLVWRAIADFLLVQTGGWRKSFTVTMGFLAPSGTKLPEERAQRQHIKQRLQTFMSSVNAHEPLRQMLLEVQQLPPPCYTDDQWQIIADLVILLPLLAAQLQLVFQEHRGVDFIEVATRARQALGSAEGPTDLALNWDYRLRHLLVDEFQDTATPQYHLLELLTSGWQPGDGRTLFLVGDPMQSIYRFREAEVGLFLRAQQHGLADIPLTALRLKVNFRSQPRLIEWINQSFSTIFPYVDEISMGAISYSPSHSPEKTDAGAVCIHPLLKDDSQNESQRVIEIITAARLENADVSIAILVRARHHASDIFTALQRANIAYQAHDMEKLSHRAVIQDCLSLTQALLHPADRIAWLAILRAPWCGLTLADCWALTQRAGSAPLWSALKQFADTPHLSSDGISRLKRIVPILTQALSQFGRASLRQWVQSTWENLGGAVCIQTNADCLNIERYFSLLETLSPKEWYDFSALKVKLDHLFATVDPQADDRLQIMTMHKSKGLEFDLVILPALERTAMTDRQQLLLWWERPRPEGEPDLLLGPIKPTAKSFDPIYSYLRFQEARKTQLENARVLYVAATRAKKTLHLLGRIEPSSEKEASTPPEGSFLDLLWPHLETSFKDLTQGAVNTTAKVSISNQLKRLPSEFMLQNTLDDIQQTDFDKTAFDNPLPPWNINQTAEHIGTVIHRTLERIANEGLTHWEPNSLAEYHPFWCTQLQELGLPHKAVHQAIEVISRAIANTLQDECGRWILSPHREHRCEYPVTMLYSNQFVHSIIDRTFIDEQGQRVIIDYKSSTPKPNQSTAVFLEEAKHFHSPQLNRYAQTLFCLEERPIQLGLYFPLATLFLSWPYEA